MNFGRGNVSFNIPPLGRKFDNQKLPHVNAIIGVPVMQQPASSADVKQLTARCELAAEVYSTLLRSEFYDTRKHRCLRVKLF